MSLNGLRNLAARPGQQRAARKPHSGIIVITPERTAYAGLLGAPSTRVYGSLSVYVSLGKPFSIQFGGRTWDEADLAVAPAYTPHLITSGDRRIGVVRLESETVDPGRLPTSLARVGCVGDPELLERIRDAFGRLRRGDPGVDPRTVDLDQVFFGIPIARRCLDPRIALVAERIRQRPCAVVDAESWAELTDLSCSRFLHLFKAEIGTTFRRYRAWKRARSVLPYIARRVNLSDLALELGYPDATHFSHSIRNFFGFAPKEIFSSSRRLAVVAQGGSQRAESLAA
jgi:AraC-like DNA-binding protein